MIELLPSLFDLLPLFLIGNLLWHDGLDDSNYATGTQVWDVYSGNDPGGSATAGRYGGRAVASDSRGSTGHMASNIHNLDAYITAASGIEMFNSVSIKPIDFSGSRWHRLITLGDGTGAVHFFCELALDGAIYIWRNDGVYIARTAPGLIQAQAYRHIEMRSRLHSTLGVIQLKVDEKLIPLEQLTGDPLTKTATVNTLDISRVGFCSVQGAGGSTVWFDDMVIMDSQGAAPYNTWAGDWRHQTLFPDAAGAFSGFTPNPAVANYLNVDEVAADGDTTHNAANVVGTKDQYGMTNLVGNVVAIFAASPCLTTKKDDGTVREVAAVVAEGGTRTVLASKNVPSSYYQKQTITLVNPRTGVAWTKAQIDAMEVGAEVTV